MPESDLDPKSICRACAGPFTGTPVNLMEEDEILKIFRTLSTTEVDPSDTLPKSICSKCNTCLQDYKRFQNVCIASYKFLLDCFPPKNNDDNPRSLRTKRKRKTIPKKYQHKEESTSVSDDDSDFELPLSKVKKDHGKKTATPKPCEKFAEVDVYETGLNSNDDDILAEIVRKCKQEAEEERKKQEARTNLLRLWVPNNEENEIKIKNEPIDCELVSKEHEKISQKSKSSSHEVKYDPKKKIKPDYDIVKHDIEEIKMDLEEIKQDSDDPKKGSEAMKVDSRNIKKDSSEIKVDMEDDDNVVDFDSDDDDADKDFDLTKEIPGDDDSDDVDFVECNDKKDKENQEKKRTRILRIETFQCEKCPKIFIMKERYEGHLREHAGLKPFECDRCDKKYARFERLKIHKLHEHSGKQLERFHCKIEGCEKTFKNRETLYKHVKAHTNPTKYKYQYSNRERRVFICELCGQALRSKSMLAEHEMMHRGEAPFSCSKCSKTFRTQRKLEVHEWRHDAVKKFECEICGLKKITKKELTSHMNIHTRKRQYTCKICNAVFLAHNNLSRHLKAVHGGMKPHVCTVCNKRFVKAITLRTHMKKKHSGDEVAEANGNTSQDNQDNQAAEAEVKTFACLLCTKEFKKMESLRTHMMRHTGERPFSCPECGKGFITRPSMLRHIRRHKEKAKEAPIYVEDEAAAAERLVASSRISLDILNNLY